MTSIPFVIDNQQHKMAVTWPVQASMNTPY
jgi:hypothetical protein